MNEAIIFLHVIRTICALCASAKGVLESSCFTISPLAMMNELFVSPPYCTKTGVTKRTSQYASTQAQRFPIYYLHPISLTSILWHDDSLLGFSPYWAVVFPFAFLQLPMVPFEIAIILPLHSINGLAGFFQGILLQLYPTQWGYQMLVFLFIAL